METRVRKRCRPTPQARPDARLWRLIIGLSVLWLMFGFALGFVFNGCLKRSDYPETHVPRAQDILPVKIPELDDCRPAPYTPPSDPAPNRPIRL
ncbi:MAG: hypothetical protein WC641_04795 [Patescibacteria group bacterium]